MDLSIPWYHLLFYPSPPSVNVSLFRLFAALGLTHLNNTHKCSVWIIQPRRFYIDHLKDILVRLRSIYIFHISEIFFLIYLEKFWVVLCLLNYFFSQYAILYVLTDCSYQTLGWELKIFESKKSNPDLEKSF